MEATTRTWVVVLIEPKIPGEPISEVAEQINQVFGPFASHDECDDWITRFQEHHVGNFEFLMTSLDDPSAI